MPLSTWVVPVLRVCYHMGVAAGCEAAPCGVFGMSRTGPSAAMVMGRVAQVVRWRAGGMPYCGSWRIRQRFARLVLVG